MMVCIVLTHQKTAKEPPMHTIVKLSALLAATLLLSGFSWSLDPCKEALELANSLSTVKDGQKLRQNEAKILSICPDGSAAHYVTALQLERVGNLDGAVSEYRKAIGQEKSFPPANGNLGLIYAQKGMLDEASVELARGLTANPNPYYQKALGKILLQRRLYPLAIHYLTEASRELNRDGEIPATLAEIYTATGQPDKAIDEYRRALSIEPGNEKAYHGIATILLEQNQPDKALAELKKAELISPQNRQTHLMMASIYEKKGDAKLAEYEYMMGGKVRKPAPISLISGEPAAEAEDFDKTVASLRATIKDSPGKALESYEKLGNIYKAAGKSEEAIVAYKDAIYLNSSNSDIYLNLGILYEKQGNLDEAVVAYKQAVKLKPGNADARLRLAEIRNERGFVQEAVEQYSEFLKLKPESPDIQLKLARIFAKSKESTLALDAYNAVLKKVPDNVEANREIANLYKLKEMDEKAIAHYKKVLAQQKDDMETRSALVSLYVKNRKYDEITLLLKDTAELFPDDPNNHYKLGLIYEFKKDFESAINSYKKAVELKPDHARALNAIGRLHMKNGNYPEAKVALEAARKADPNLEETVVLLNNMRDSFNPEPHKISKKTSTTKNKKSTKKAKTGKNVKSKKAVKKTK